MRKLNRIINQTKMNTTTLSHLRALEEHHQKALNAVRDLIQLHFGESESPQERLEAYIMPTPAQVGTILNRSEHHRLQAQVRDERFKTRPSMKLSEVVFETLTALEQDNFDTTDVLRAIKAKYPDEFMKWHHASFSKELTRLAESGLIRVEVQGAGRRATRYSK